MGYQGRLLRFRRKVKRTGKAGGAGDRDGTADGFELLAQAHDYLLAAVRAVPTGWWDAPTPCTVWAVGEVYHHARLDQQALTIPDLAGHPRPWPGGNASLVRSREAAGFAAAPG
ncbi:maleylpyruvate isomerase N-terminal domain-containing protein [Kitasatospora sp. NPDC048722]|uniref:maleylpyruvate isomerase N-terminal domain-containing protein n=1 Tax=Kitasatospora sp. NPDC048722 TaxID=3155639 RepID=UPI00340C2F57